MSTQNNLKEMSQKLLESGSYTRNLIPEGSVTYLLDQAGDNNTNVAVWEIVLATNGTDVQFTARFEKSCHGKKEALRWLINHRNDPLLICNTARGWKS